jgi:hypothetical protein
MNKTITAIIVILIIIVGGWFLFFRDGGVDYSRDQEAGINDEASGSQGRVMSAEDYIKANIASLAAEQDIVPASGGEFNVTSVESADGSGTAYFNDGTSSYMADFTYTTDPTTGAISITGFTIYPIIGEKG